MLSFVEIDRNHNLAYILLRPELRDRRGAVARSVRVGEDIVLDLDEADHLIGIELLNASSRLAVDELEAGTREIIVGVSEAAEMLGVERSNFVRDYANKLGFPAPIAEHASGRFWLRSAIERYAEGKRTPRLKSIADDPRIEVTEMGGSGNSTATPLEGVDTLAVGIRTHDMHHGLIRKHSGLINRFMKRTKIIGTAAQLCNVLKDSEVIADYGRLEIAAGEIGIDGPLLEKALRELREIEFVRLREAGGEIRRVDVTIPLLKKVYTELGTRWNETNPTDQERVSIEILDQLALMPVKTREIQRQHNLNAEDLDIIRAIGANAGYFGSYQSRSDGEEIMFSPLHWDEHPENLERLASKYRTTEVVTALRKVRAYPGMPADRVTDEVLRDALQSGVLPTPSVDSLAGLKFFLFTPGHNVERHEKGLLDKARTIIACVRYGEVFGTITKIRNPLLLLRRLRERKRLNPHTEILRQYVRLRDLGVGIIAKERGTSRYTFHLTDNEENLKALDLAIAMLQVGEPLGEDARIHSAKQSLLAPGVYLNPTATRAAFSAVEPARYSNNTIERINDLIRGVSIEAD